MCIINMYDDFLISGKRETEVYDDERENVLLKNKFLLNSRSKESEIKAAVLRNPDTALWSTLMLSCHPRNEGSSQGEVREDPTPNLRV